MAESNKVMASVLYYAREGYYRHVQTVVMELLKTYGSDPALLFWKAYGIVMEDRTSEGIRELENIADNRDMVLCSSMLMIHAHKKCKTVDREAIQQLEGKIRSERTTCGEKSLYYAGMFLWLTGKHDKAREYISRMFKMSPASKEGLTLQGWIDLTCNRDAFVKKSVKYFDEVLAGCKHYFCEVCALDQFKKSTRCAACGQQTGGVFNPAKGIVAKMKKVEEEQKAKMEGENPSD